MSNFDLQHKTNTKPHKRRLTPQEIINKSSNLSGSKKGLNQKKNLNTITIKDTVGQNGKNNIEDVKKIQKRLMHLGFLNVNDFNIENIVLFSKKQDNNTIAEENISKTIEAIQFYESIVLLIKKEPSGKIYPNGSILKLMNTNPKDVIAFKNTDIDGTIKINKAEELLNTSNNPKLKNLLNKTKDFPIVKRAKVLQHKKEINGRTLLNPKKPNKGVILISTEKAKFRTFLEVLNTIIHEKGHAYLFLIEKTPSNKLSSQEKLIKKRLLDIKNAIRNIDSTTNIKGFEGIKFTLKEFKKLKSERQHIAIVEFFLNETVEILKEFLKFKPEVFGTINVNLKKDIKTFQSIVGQSELGKRQVPSIRLLPFQGLSTYYRNNIDKIKEQLKK